MPIKQIQYSLLCPHCAAGCVIVCVGIWFHPIRKGESTIQYFPCLADELRKLHDEAEAKGKMASKDAPS